MEDGKPNETDTDGKKDDPDTPKTEGDISELDKLKAHNKELETELIKGRQLKAEIQKLEAEKMRGGKTDAGQEEKPEMTDSEKRVQAFGETTGAAWAKKTE